jgi:hypothetical protein
VAHPAGHRGQRNRTGSSVVSFPNFPTPIDPDLRASFAKTYFRISERTSGLYANTMPSPHATGPTATSTPTISPRTIGSVPSITLKFGRASTWLGSEADFFRFKAEAHINARLPRRFQNLGASWESRDYSDGLRDQLIKAQFYAATPVLARSFRVVASGVAGFVADNVHRAQVYVGGLEGLRGYPVNIFLGYDWYHAHLELRSMALSVASLRLGGLVFADAGHAADARRRSCSTATPAQACACSFPSSTPMSCAAIGPSPSAPTSRSRRAGLGAYLADFARFSSFRGVAFLGPCRSVQVHRGRGWRRLRRGIGQLSPQSARVMSSSESLRCVPAVHLFVLSL